MTHPYATRAYAESLAHAGAPFFVPEWNCHVLARGIEDGAVDAAGTYPVSPIAPDADIEGGLARLTSQGFVSAVLVLDDFHRPPLETLKPRAALLRPYKTHYLHRPSLGAPRYPEHHRRALKKAKGVRVEMLPLERALDGWCELYDGLIAQLSLKGLHAFPHDHHQRLAKLDGVIAACGFIGDALASCHVWVEHKGRVHSHLVASSEAGYAARAGFAVNAASIEHFSQAEIINFGGGAGNEDDPEDGLARFKRGFSNDTAKSYLWGIILDEARYRALCERRGKTGSGFFPAYRG